MGAVAGLVLLLLSGAYVFWPERNPYIEPDKTRVDSLRERKESIYANLRDLNFEFQAGKYPEEDYAGQRQILEDEAAHVLAEIETLEAAGVRRTR